MKLYLVLTLIALKILSSWLTMWKFRVNRYRSVFLPQEIRMCKMTDLIHKSYVNNTGICNSIYRVAQQNFSRRFLVFKMNIWNRALFYLFLIWWLYLKKVSADRSDDLVVLWLYSFCPIQLWRNFLSENWRTDCTKWGGAPYCWKMIVWWTSSFSNI